MKRLRRFTAAAVCALAVVAVFTAAVAAVVPQPSERFGRLVIPDPSWGLAVAAETPEQFAAADGVKGRWDAFAQASGGTWRVHLDRRSGTPLLVQGSGLSFAAPGVRFTTTELLSTARGFIAANESVFGVRESELVLAPGGAAVGQDNRFSLNLQRSIKGIEVEGQQFVLQGVAGRLVSFGATGWAPTPSVTTPAVDGASAWAAVRSYMGLTPNEAVESVETGQLVFVPVPAVHTSGASFAGPAGTGVDLRLAWRFGVHVPGEEPVWTVKVDAATGAILAFYDGNLYAAVRAGVYPMSNDGNCLDGGCEVSGYPVPYADVSIGNKAVATDDMGTFACGKGNKNSSVKLSGPYVIVSDICGTATISGQCTSDLDFGAGTGTNCTTPTGLPVGDTHAARTSYYHLNRVKEKARYWLPANSWVDQQLNDRVNVNGTCNAFWNGNVNFYRSGGGCRNAGEIAGVMCHEYGHGLDQNDGGGYDNPSEGYGDVTAIFQEHRSCVGRGFFQSGVCSGYGDTCLSCSGIRDMDWAQRVRNTPATPANFTGPNCGGGGGPCGREVHCEGYVPAEALYDLATRDLPASGLDAATAWQVAERLWYTSRQGSSGRAFNCSLPSSDGCIATSWFNKLLAQDDDDGNLANGTPHAAAIFAAFDRHAIACGLATDPSNQSTSSCPALAAPTVTVTPGAGQVGLSWTAVPGAAKYRVLRSDIGCDSSSSVLADVTGTSYTDVGLIPANAEYYRIQPVGSNAACDGAVSACSTTAAN